VESNIYLSNLRGLWRASTDQQHVDRDDRALAVTHFLRTPLIALLVAIGYCAGTEIGFLFTPTQTSTSTFWPPNAILLAAFLLTPARIWWALLLAVLPAHLLVQLHAGIPVSTLLGWFVGNTGEALLGAACIRYFEKDSRSLFKTVHGVTIFLLFGVFAAPALTSFLDAAVVVQTGLGSDYWMVWTTRLFTNMLANVAIVPTIVLLGVNGLSWIREASLARCIEAVILSVGIVLGSILLFSGGKGWQGNTPALLYGLVPFLLWASVRFGVGGLNASLVTIALISMWNVIHGRDPFISGSLEQNILTLKIYLITVSVPLMFLSAVTQEMLRSSRELIHAQEQERDLLHMATQAGKMLAYEWDAATDKIVRSEGVIQILGEDEGTHTTGQHILSMVPPEDRERLSAAVAQLSPEKPYLRIKYRMVRSDSTIIWIDRTSRAYFDEHGKMLRIVGMLADITDRVWAEEALRQKDRELSEAQRLAEVGSWYWDAQNDVVTWSEELYRIAGLDPKLPAPSFKEIPQFYTPESWERLQRAVEKAQQDGASYELDLEVVRSDGTTRWVRTRGEAVGDTTGRIVGLRGTAQDITERKLAEEALADMSRKLIEAQEQERARIGRELHDDINQRLGILSVEIDRMKEAAPATYGELRSRMDELGKRTSEISDTVQSLSHELHSSKLEYLGLVSAMRGFCKEFSDKHKVEIDFSSEGMPSTVPPDVSLCLFRVMQEGLQNALKHSGVRFFEVKLHGSSTDIQLTVRDSGVGFDPELIKDTQGLGLISMQERVRLVKGAIMITSRPQSGTEIDVRVPLSAGEQTERAKLAGA
jgi:PAS domain S-box-containing protein